MSHTAPHQPEISRWNPRLLRDLSESPALSGGLLLLLLIGFDVDDVLGLPSVTSPIRRAARTLRLDHCHV